MSEVLVPFPAANENDSMKAHANWYKGLGLSPFGIPSKTKKADLKGWAEGDHSTTVTDSMNIACRLDELVDVDVDLHPGGPFMSLLAPSNFVFGRESAPCTHHIYKVTGEAKTKKFTVTKAFAEKYLGGKETIVEIRTGKHYTVFPPSTHPSLEVIRFDTIQDRLRNGDPTEIEFKELHRCAAITALSSVMEVMWPGEGSRQDAVLAAAGVMKKYFNVSRDECGAILMALAKGAGDEELKSRRAAVIATYKEGKKDGRLSGWKKFKDVFRLEDEDIAQFKTWLKGDASIDQDEVEKLKEQYKIVVHAGSTALWSKRRNHSSKRDEWIEHSVHDIKLQNHFSPAVTTFLKDETVPVYHNGFSFDPSTTDWPEGGINKWTGWSVQAKEGDWSTIRNHIHEVLCEGKDEYFNYVIKWCAYFVQHPERRAEVALVFRGEKGTGKGQFLNALARFAPQYSHQISSASQLIGRFNDHFHDCIFVYADEAMWAGNKEGEGNFKRMITEPTLSIEGKGKSVFQSDNMLHIAIASNATWTVPTSKGERRFAAFDVSSKYQKNMEYFRKLSAAFEGDELKAFFYHLKNFDLGDDHPRYGIPNTKALQSQNVQSSAFTVDGLLRGWLEDGCLPGTHAALGFPNRVLMYHALISGNGKFNKTILGELLAQYAVKTRPQVRTRPIEGGDIAHVRATAYTFGNLVEVRKQFDPDAHWDSRTDWEPEFDGDASVPYGKDRELVLPVDDNPPF